jgi:hypothetical protein
MRTLIALLIAASVAACGGPEDGLVEKYGLHVQAQAWENHMPTVVFPGQALPCTGLIVRFVVSSTSAGLPTDITPEAVTLKKATGAAWVGAVASSETERSSASLAGVARGCRSEAFADGDELDVAVRVRSGATRTDVETKVRLFYAS